MRHKEPTRGDLQKKVSGLGPALSKATIFFTRPCPAAWD